MINILYIADPSSIHDQKWIEWFISKSEFSVFLLVRERHKNHPNPLNLNIIGVLEDVSITQPWKNNKGKRLINQLIKKHEIDLLHIFYAEPNLLWLNKLDTNTNSILTTRGSDLLVGIQNFTGSGVLNKIILKQYKKAIKKLDAVISTSIKQLNFVKTNLNRSKNLHLIRTGFNTGELLPEADTKNTVFFPRNMEPLYHHELAIEAISTLAVENVQDLEFVFVDKASENKSYVVKIDALLQNLQGYNIRFLPKLDKTAYYQLLAQSRLVVMTPKSDGAPVSAMEAIAAGCQVILPDLNYDNDLFDQALLYEPGNSNALAAQMKIALATEQNTASQDYLKKVDRSAQMLLVENLYYNILKAKR